MHDSTEAPVKVRKHPFLREDTSAPISVEVHDVQDDARAQNHAVMEMCNTMGRRVRIRIQPEVWVKWGGKWNYKRARQRAVTLSCPSPEQAELLIDAIMETLRVFDGKFVAGSRCYDAESCQ